jgi:hypothetical protein
MAGEKSTVLVTVNRNITYNQYFDGSKFVFIRTDTVIKMSDKKEKPAIGKIRDFKTVLNVLKKLILLKVLDWML